MHRSNRMHPRINSNLFEFGASHFMNIGKAIIKDIKTYQPASINVAVKTIIDFDLKEVESPRNWVNIAKKKAATFGFKNTIKKPDCACQIKEFAFLFIGTLSNFSIIKLLLSMIRANHIKNNRPPISTKNINIGANDNVILRPKATKNA
jgi:hypothetical protein